VRVAAGIGALVAARAAQGVGAALLLPGLGDHQPDVFRSGLSRPGRWVWAGVGSAALPAGPLLGGAGAGVRLAGGVLPNVPVVAVASVVAAHIVREARKPDARRPELGRGAAGKLGARRRHLRRGARRAPGAGPARYWSPRRWRRSRWRASCSSSGRCAIRCCRRACFAEPTSARPTPRPGRSTWATLGLLFLLTLYLQAVRGRSALAAGVALFCPLVVLASPSRRLAAWLGPRPAVTAGLLLAAVCVGLLARLTPGSPYLALAPALLAWGWASACSLRR
jgi:DHA2 family methylenomycin A resistance protein-like MFS transporter